MPHNQLQDKKKTESQKSNENTSLLHRQQSFLQSNICGIILVTLSATSFGLSATMVSMVSDVATPLVIASRFLGSAVLTTIVCAAKRVDIRVSSENWRVLFCRSAFGLLSFACGTYAFQHMPVGEATVLISVAPVFVALLSVCFLGEPISTVKVMAIILSLCGVLLIVDLPNFFTIGKSFHIPKLSLILAALAALGQAMSKASAYVVIRKSNNRIYYLTLVFWYTVLSFIVTLLAILVGFFSFQAAGRDTSQFVTKLQPKHYLYLTMVSCLGFISQVTLTKGTQMVNTTTVSLIRNGDILVTVLFQVFYFRIVPSFQQIIGMIIMVSSTLLTVLIKEKDCQVADADSVSK